MYVSLRGEKQMKFAIPLVDILSFSTYACYAQQTTHEVPDTLTPQIKKSAGCSYSHPAQGERFKGYLKPVVLASILMIAPLATAQDSHGETQVGPSIVSTAGMVPTADLAAAGQRYGFRDAGLRVTVPLLGGWDWDNKEMSKFRLLAHAGFNTDSALVPFTTGRLDLYALEVGVSGVHILNPKNQITWSVGTRFAADSSTISSPKPKLTGRVVAAYRKSDSLTLFYGGSYSFVLGRGKLLPVFGFRWRPRPGTTVSILGPFRGHVQQRVGQRLMVGAQGGLRGNQYHIANNDQFSSARWGFA
jgi:hypothetical protein